MSKEILSLQTILNDTRWIAKMTYGRFSGTRSELESYLEDNDHLRDFDISCSQPAHLEKFYNDYWEYDKNYGWITIQDYYENIWYSKEMDRLSMIDIDEHEAKVDQTLWI